MKKRPRRLSECLNTGTTMQALLSNSRLQQALLLQVRTLLPAPISEHCAGVVQHGRQLLLYADSSAWAGRLRFVTRGLTAQLKQSGLNLDRITVRVLLKANPRQQKKSHRIRQLSSDNAALLVETAETIDDPDLRAAMKRLARHHK